MSIRPRALRAAIGQVLAWLIAGLVVLVLAAVVIIPRLGGGSAYTILTGSMRPTMPPGTLVVDRHAPPSQIRIGDVVTYQLHSGQPEVATHRVVAISISLRGDYVFTTKGDANPSPDPTPVEPVQIRGKVWYAVPYLAWPTLYVGTDIRAVTVLTAVAALLAYAIWSFGGAVVESRRRRPRRANRSGSVEQDHKERVEAMR